jgi:phosphoribosylglycinamide formyltransferase-1
MARLKVGVLISGRGSNLQALLDAAAQPGFPAEIALVVSNRAGAGGLARAERAGVRTVILEHTRYPDRDSFDRAIEAALNEAGVGLVCLAGFMRLLSDGFCKRWHDRLINIHPSLLPAFKGMHVHEAALKAGVRISGCTVHFVRPAVDSGPIIVQAAVPVLADDTPDALADRILAAEHRIYPLALRLIAEGRVSVANERVLIAGGRAPDDVLINPLS